MGSQSDTIVVGKPCNRTISWMNTAVTDGAIKLVDNEAKWACLESLSTTINITVFPEEDGK